MKETTKEIFLDKEKLGESLKDYLKQARSMGFWKLWTNEKQIELCQVMFKAGGEYKIAFMFEWSWKAFFLGWLYRARFLVLDLMAFVGIVFFYSLSSGAGSFPALCFIATIAVFHIYCGLTHYYAVASDLFRYLETGKKHDWVYRCGVALFIVYILLFYGIKIYFKYESSNERENFFDNIEQTITDMASDFKSMLLDGSVSRKIDDGKSAIKSRQKEQKTILDDGLSAEVRLYQKSCAEGKAKGCLYLGEKYEKGEDVAHDEQKAAEYYKKACDMGESEGCARSNAPKGKAIEKPAAQSKPQNNNLEEIVAKAKKAQDNMDLQTATKLYDEACELGAANACKELGRIFGEDTLNDISLRKNYKKALALYEKECKAGNRESCFEGFTCYHTTGDVFVGDEKILPEAKWLIENYFSFSERDCEAGEAKACSDLAGAAGYWDIYSVDEAKFIKYNIAACEGGFLDECSSLGDEFSNKKSSRFDGEKAVYYYDKICASEDGYACERIGDLYGGKDGILKPNIAKMREYYEKSCNLQSLSCVKLGASYRDTEPRDYAKAREFFKKDCDKDIKDGKIRDRGVGCNNLGVMYYEGKGGEKNLQKAAEYFGFACRFGDQIGCKNYQIVNRQ